MANAEPYKAWQSASQALVRKFIASLTALSNNVLKMSVSTLQTDIAWQGVQSSYNVPMKVALLPERASADAVARWRDVVDCVEFPARLVIPDVGLAIPEQSFTAMFAERSASFENESEGSWPKIIVRFATEPLGERRARNFLEHLSRHEPREVLVRPAGDTVNAQLLYTRFKYCLYKAGRFSLNVSAGRLFGISIDPPLETELHELLNFAKLYRKLKYIENTFNVEFTLPKKISAEAVGQIDIVFRGITEGEFATRRSQITFPSMSPSEIDLSRPPFDHVGAFSRSVRGEATIFDQTLPIGPMTVLLNNAELANPTVIDQVKAGLTDPIDVRFEVLDNQVVFRFEAYAARPQRERTELLAQFKIELSQEEPQELVDLIDEPLEGNVSSREASQIAMGWTLYNDLPDRYCPQVPELDVTAGKWRVPIYLVYANGEGGPVGEVVIDEKTGVIVSHTPVDELRSNGRALAEQILHA